MPLFNYMCVGCKLVVEKFQHKPSDKIDIKCKECGKSDFVRVIGNIRPKVKYNAKDTYKNRIMPDVERINNNLAKGKDSDFLDIAGD